MASEGPPTDPPGPAGDPEDWGWGDSADADAAGGRDAGGRPPRRGAGPAGARDAVGGAPTGRARPSSATESPSAGAPASARPRRSRLRVRVPVRGALAAVVLAAIVLVGLAIAAGGDGDEGPGSSRGDDRLRSLASVAARATLDELERSAAVDRYARIGLPIYCGAGRRPWVALTFDDGPGLLSPRFIARLAKADVPMTLFRVGRNVPGNEEYVRVQRNLGWDSGSHTQNHVPLGDLGPRDQRREITLGSASNQRALGRPTRLFRPPYESHDRTTDRLVRELGLVQVLWNVDTGDALGATSVDDIVSAARRGMRPGSIILLHEVKPNTLAAMPRIAAALRARGLKPVTVTRMLASDGPSEAQLRKGYDGCAAGAAAGRAES